MILNVYQSLEKLQACVIARCYYLCIIKRKHTSVKAMCQCIVLDL